MKKYDVKKARIFTRAYSDYMEIENDQDLKKNKITLAEHAIIFDLLKEFSTLPDYCLLTSFSGVAAWFKSKGFFIKVPDGENINYSIGF